MSCGEIAAGMCDNDAGEKTITGSKRKRKNG